MNKIKIDSNRNYILWKKYIKLNSQRQMIITFIDSGILDDNPQLLRDELKPFIKVCDDFYNYLKETLNTKDEIADYNIAFHTREYSYTVDSESEYNKLDFAINSLDLKPSFKYLIYRLIEGEIE